MKSTVLLAKALAPLALYGQDFVELRTGHNRYRFADYSHTFKNSAVLDMFYVAVPGANEVDMGGGYCVKLGPVTLTPLAYYSFLKEGRQSGAKAAILGSAEWRGWKSGWYLARGVNFANNHASYLVLDTLDVTRAAGKRWEVGASFGLFRNAGAWNAQLGPIVKRNDRLGVWYVSARGGPQKELRFGRIITR